MHKITKISPFIALKFTFGKKKFIENLAVVLALLYVVGAAYGKNWCWLASIVSSALYFILCYQTHLFLESALQIFFIVMSILGWTMWNKKNSNNEYNLKITTNSVLQNSKFISALALFSLLLGFIFSKYTAAALPFLDAPIAVFSIYATFLAAKKKLESWIYWFFINLASIYLYFQRDLKTTSILFCVYCLISVYGFYKWSKMYKISKLQ
jgi:nicotinamide mononucleotide transporter